MNSQQVLDLFIDQNVLQKTQADDVLTDAQQNGKSIAQAIIDNGFTDEAGFIKPSRKESALSWSILTNTRSCLKS